MMGKMVLGVIAAFLTGMSVIATAIGEMKSDK